PCWRGPSAGLHRAPPPQDRDPAGVLRGAPDRLRPRQSVRGHSAARGVRLYPIRHAVAPATWPRHESTPAHRRCPDLLTARPGQPPSRHTAKPHTVGPNISAGVGPFLVAESTAECLGERVVAKPGST